MRPTTGPRSRAGVGAPRCRGVRADVAVGPLVPGIHLELEAVGRSPHQDSLPVLHLAAQDQPGETVADLLLHQALEGARDRKSTRLNSSHVSISYAVFCLKKKNDKQ